MACPSYNLIPTPPTTLSSCAVPIGGSNSSILDACCNGHINAITTYSAPDADTNSEDDDGCFQYCVTDSPAMVQSCLTQNMEIYQKKEGVQAFECFNVDAVKKSGGRSEGEYNSAGVRASGRVGWAMGIVLTLGIVGTAMGST
ncbi:hypothetical protein ACN47E_007800 [Coniothyrium glycines]